MLTTWGLHSRHPDFEKKNPKPRKAKGSNWKPQRASMLRILAV